MIRFTHLHTYFCRRFILEKRFFLKASLDRNGNLLRINYLFHTTKKFSTYPKGKGLLTDRGTVYLMFLCFLCKFSQALQHGPKLYSAELAAEDVWLDKVRDW